MKTVLMTGLILAGAMTMTLSKHDTDGLLLVADQKDQNLRMIDLGSTKTVGEVAGSDYTGHEVAVSPDGRTAYVPIYGNSGVGKPGTDGRVIDVVDVRSRKVVGKVDFGHGVRPHCAVYDKNSGMLYVTTELDKTVSIIDPRSLKVVGQVPTGQAESHMLVLTKDGRRGYTANVGPGTVSVLDMAGRKLIAVIPVSKTTQRISISRDDRRIFTADQTTPRLAVIDSATNTVSGWIALPGVGYGTAATPDGKHLLVALPSLNEVGVVDLSTMKVSATVKVGQHPTEILVRPDSKIAYVSCMGSGQIAVIDLASMKPAAMLAAGRGADGLALIAN